MDILKIVEHIFLIPLFLSSAFQEWSFPAEGRIAIIGPSVCRSACITIGAGGLGTYSFDFAVDMDRQNEDSNNEDHHVHTKGVVSSRTSGVKPPSTNLRTT